MIEVDNAVSPEREVRVADADVLGTIFVMNSSPTRPAQYEFRSSCHR